MKDTLLNRMKAIEAMTGGNTAFDIECFVHLDDVEKRDEKKILEQLRNAERLLSDIYYLSHGFLSFCCKGKGGYLIEPAIKTYFGKSGRRTSFKKKRHEQQKEKNDPT